jgi:hypothetical protein
MISGHTLACAPAADQDSAMLQTDSNFSRIFNDMPLPCRHRVNERPDQKGRAAVVVDLYQKFFARYV